MKVAKKSSRGRYTLTLPVRTYEAIDRLRQGQPRSAFVESLVDREISRIERELLLAELRRQYSPDVCRETLRTNSEFPIHDA